MGQFDEPAVITIRFVSPSHAGVIAMRGSIGRIDSAAMKHGAKNLCTLKDEDVHNMFQVLGVQELRSESIALRSVHAADRQ